MKISKWFIPLCLYLGFVFGQLLSAVGEPRPSYTFEWYDPITGLVLFIIPVWFAYEAGTEEADTEARSRT